MIRFMGNGRRIEKVTRCLSSGFVSHVLHVKSGTVQFVDRHDSMGSVSRFMNDHGYGDVYVLNVAEWKDIE